MKTRISIIRKAYFPVTNSRTEDEAILEFAKEISSSFDEIKHLEEYPFIDSRDIPVSLENIAYNIFKKLGLPMEFTLGYRLLDIGKSNVIFSHGITNASEELKLCELAKAGSFDYHNDDINRKLGSDEDGLYRIVSREGVDIKTRLSPEDINFLLLQKDDDDEDDEDM